MIDLVKMHADVAEILTMPVDKLHGDIRLQNSDNWDSMARIGIVALVFEKTGASVSGEDIMGIVTVQDLFDLIDRKIKEAA
jgi:acyl carrier protein